MTRLHAVSDLPIVLGARAVATAVARAAGAGR
jgi:hypothetical protein